MLNTKPKYRGVKGVTSVMLLAQAVTKYTVHVSDLDCYRVLAVKYMSSLHDIL